MNKKPRINSYTEKITYMKFLKNKKTYKVKVTDACGGIIDIEVLIEPTTKERVQIINYVMNELERKVV